VRTRPLRIVFVLIVAGTIAALLLGCVFTDMLQRLNRPEYLVESDRAIAAAEQIAADAKRAADEAEAKKNAEAGVVVLQPDMTSVTGPNILTFAGEHPAPSGFALMNQTGFEIQGFNENRWVTQKTVTYVPTGGRTGYDRYVLDVYRAKDGSLSGTLTYVRKMVLVEVDRPVDFATITQSYTGDVTGKVDSGGSIAGEVNGAFKGDETYVDTKLHPKPDINPPYDFTWTFTGQL